VSSTCQWRHYTPAVQHQQPFVNVIMSVLMTAGKKAAQARAEKESKKKKKTAAVAAAANRFDIIPRLGEVLFSVASVCLFVCLFVNKLTVKR